MLHFCVCFWLKLIVQCLPLFMNQNTQHYIASSQDMQTSTLTSFFINQFVCRLLLFAFLFCTVRTTVLRFSHLNTKKHIHFSQNMQRFSKLFIFFIFFCFLWAEFSVNTMSLFFSQRWLFCVYSYVQATCFNSKVFQTCLQNIFFEKKKQKC